MTESSILQFQRRRTPPLLLQVEVAECGLACLAMIAAFHGYETDLVALRRRFPLSLKGMSLKTMIGIADRLGLAGRALRCELEELAQVRMPAIMHWGMNHYVVLASVDRDRVHILDPAAGARSITLQEVSQKFTGVLLELYPARNFEKKDDRSSLRLKTLVSLPNETRSAFGQALLLSLVIETFALAMPFYAQLVLDETIVKADTELLATLTIAFCIVTLLNVAASALRGLTLQYISSVLAFHMQARVFRHLLRLPMEWFTKRQIGDVQSRIVAIQPIQQFISRATLSAFFDGVLGALILGVMFYYAQSLTWLVLSSFAVYSVVRAVSMKVMKRLNNDVLVAGAREQSRLLETLRAMQSIKAAGMEPGREGLQLTAAASLQNSVIQQNKAQVGFEAWRRGLNGITDMVVMFLGAKAVIEGRLSVGMLMAFVAYKQQIMERLGNVLEQVIEWRLLDVQLDRLADIVLHPAERQLEAEGCAQEIQGAVECCNLSFRYGEGEPAVLSNLNLKIAPGEFVAITGPSGSGKSTLVNLLAGLYQPESGEVRVDGRAVTLWDRQVLRSQVAVVFQSDQLLSGSLAENIAFFDESIDMERVVECAHRAGIHDEIQAMPMGYHSLVGDMGSVLSGGQKQRVLIARALYRKPKILILDEGTSHLDVTNERRVNAALAGIAITRIVVAHRPETIAAADREIRLDQHTGGSSAASTQLKVVGS